MQIVESVRGHRLFSNMGRGSAGQSFHHADLLDPAQLIPDAWLEESTAIGSVGECVAMRQQFKNAGADEIAIYGSTPSENAALIDAWRLRSAG